MTPTINWRSEANDNDKYTHKQIHKFELLERPIDMVDEDNHNNNLDNDNGDYFLWLIASKH